MLNNIMVSYSKEILKIAAACLQVVNEFRNFLSIPKPAHRSAPALFIKRTAVDNTPPHNQINGQNDL